MSKKVKDNPCTRCGGIPYITHPAWAPFNNGLCFRCNGSGFDPHPYKHTMRVRPVEGMTLADITRQVTDEWERLGIEKLSVKAKKRALLMRDVYIKATLKSNQRGMEGAFTAFENLLTQEKIEQ